MNATITTTSSSTLAAGLAELELAAFGSITQPGDDPETAFGDILRDSHEEAEELADLGSLIEKAQPGSVIMLKEKRYFLKSETIISKSLTFSGMGPERTVIEIRSPLRFVASRGKSPAWLLVSVGFELGWTQTALSVAGGEIEFLWCQFSSSERRPRGQAGMHIHYGSKATFRESVVPDSRSLVYVSGSGTEVLIKDCVDNRGGLPDETRHAGEGNELLRKAKDTPSCVIPVQATDDIWRPGDTRTAAPKTRPQPAKTADSVPSTQKGAYWAPREKQRQSWIRKARGLLSELLLNLSKAIAD